jgi:hypothetical protein
VPLTFISAKPVKYWNGSSWTGSGDFGAVKMWNGSAWQYVGIRPYADVALTTFSPDGGTVGSPTELTDYQYQTQATVTITASSSVVWTYTGGDGVNGYANFGSGGSGSSITFFAAFTNGYNNQQFNVSASNGATTKYWFIDLTSDSFA